MDRRVLWTVMLILGTALNVSCGDDSDGGGGAGTSGGKAGTAPDGKKIECETNEMVCGEKCCGQGPGQMAPACCSDPFEGVCGMSVSVFGSTPACIKQVASVSGCPPLSVGPISIPSCCTPEKMCGLDASLFGMPGCTELGEAQRRAMQMFMMPPMTPATAGTTASTDEDGGVAGAGGMSGGTAGRAAGGRTGGGFMLPMFPAPQACPN